MEPFRSNETFFYGASHARLNLPLSYLHKTAKIGSNSIETYNLDWRREWMLCISIPSMKINKWVLSNIASSLVAGWRGEWWEQILQNELHKTVLWRWKKYWYAYMSMSHHRKISFTSPVSLVWTNWKIVLCFEFFIKEPKVFEGQRAFITRIVSQFYVSLCQASRPLSWRRFRLVAI